MYDILSQPHHHSYATIIICMHRYALLVSSRMSSVPSPSAAMLCAHEAYARLVAVAAETRAKHEAEAQEERETSEALAAEERARCVAAAKARRKVAEAQAAERRAKSEALAEWCRTTAHSLSPHIPATPAAVAVSVRGIFFSPVTDGPGLFLPQDDAVESVRAVFLPPSADGALLPTTLADYARHVKTAADTTQSNALGTWKKQPVQRAAFTINKTSTGESNTPSDDASSAAAVLDVRAFYANRLASGPGLLFPPQVNAGNVVIEPVRVVFLPPSADGALLPETLSEHACHVIRSADKTQSVATEVRAVFLPPSVEVDARPLAITTPADSNTEEDINSSESREKSDATSQRCDASLAVEAPTLLYPTALQNAKPNTTREVIDAVAQEDGAMCNVANSACDADSAASSASTNDTQAAREHTHELKQSTETVATWLEHVNSAAPRGAVGSSSEDSDDDVFADDITEAARVSVAEVGGIPDFDNANLASEWNEPRRHVNERYPTMATAPPASSTNQTVRYVGSQSSSLSNRARQLPVEFSFGDPHVGTYISGGCANGRAVFRGPRGGLYHITASGSKSYVNCGAVDFL